MVSITYTIVCSLKHQPHVSCSFSRIQQGQQNSKTVRMKQMCLLSRNPRGKQLKARICDHSPLSSLLVFTLC